MAKPIEEPGWIRDDAEWMRYCSWIMMNLAVGTKQVKKGCYRIVATNKVGAFWAADGRCVTFTDAMNFYARQTKSVEWIK